MVVPPLGLRDDFALIRWNLSSLTCKGPVEIHESPSESVVFRMCACGRMCLTARKRVRMKRQVTVPGMIEMVREMRSIMEADGYHMEARELVDLEDRLVRAQ